MKKILSVILVVLLMMSMAGTAFAETDTTQLREGSFELTTNIPAASWVLNISAETEIPFRSTETHIATVSVSNVADSIPLFALELRLQWDEMASPYSPMSLPMDIVADIYDSETGAFIERRDGSDPYSLDKIALFTHDKNDVLTNHRAELYAIIAEEDWDRLGPDTLSTTVTYIVQYVHMFTLEN